MQGAHSVWQQLAHSVREDLQRGDPARGASSTSTPSSSAASSSSVSPSSSSSIGRAVNRVFVDMSAGRLERQLSKRHHRRVRLLPSPQGEDGDGNLLFRVLFDVLMHGAEDHIVAVQDESDGHVHLRAQLCQRLRNMHNDPLYCVAIDQHVAFIGGQNALFGDYVSKMSAAGQRGGCLEMWAFCFEFSANVRISYPKSNGTEVDELLITTDERTGCPDVAVFDIGWVAAAGQSGQGALLTRFVSTQRKLPAVPMNKPFQRPASRIRMDSVLHPNLPNQAHIVPSSSQPHPGRGLLRSPLP